MVDVPFLLSPFFVDYVLPLVLVFTLIFAILQKSQLLGDNQKQVNAIIGIVVGLLLISFPFSRNIVVGLMPFLAVFAVILLVFMLLYGFISGKKEGDVLNKGLKITFGIILGISLVVVLLMLTGFWDNVVNFVFFGGQRSSQVFVNGVILLVIAGAVIAVIWGGEKGSKG